MMNSNVKMRLMDIDGIIIADKDKDNLRNRLVPEEEEAEGEVVFEINTGVDPSIPIAPNVDYEYEEMTPEQREVFEAMQHADEGYEELEDDFVRMATGGESILTETPALTTIQDIQNAMNNDIKQVKGSLLSHDEFKKIIEQDRKALGLPPKSTDTKDQNKPKTVLKKPAPKAKMEEIPPSADLAEEEELPEEKNKQKQVQFAPTEVDMSVGLGGMEMFGIGPQKMKKGEVVTDEKMQILPGGGRLILRTVQKSAGKKDEKSDTQTDEPASKRPKAKDQDPHDDDDDDEEAWEDDADMSDEEGEVYEEEVFDDENFSDEGYDEDIEDLPYVVDPNRSHISKSDGEGKEYSESDDESPMTNDQLRQLYKEYKENKAKQAQGGKQKMAPPPPEKEEEEEEVECTPWDYHNDKLAQAQAYEEVGKVVIDDDYYIGKPKPDGGSCAQAPAGNKKHTNYFCMEVVKDNDDVKPVPPKPKKQKIDKTAHKIDSQVPARKREETKEEKAERKKMAKEIKDAKRDRNREFKTEFKKMKNDLVKQRNRTKLADPLQGISKHVIKDE